jgi:endoglucanase
MRKSRNRKETNKQPLRAKIILIILLIGCFVIVAFYMFNNYKQKNTSIIQLQYDENTSLHQEVNDLNQEANDLNQEIEKLNQQYDKEFTNKQKEITDLKQELEELKNPYGGVKYNDRLSVEGNKLVNQYGTQIQLKGISSHGIIWYPEYTNYRAIKTLRDLGANVFRVAMYTEPRNAYIRNPALSERKARMAIENALGADLYVILDWHILNDSNPNTYLSEATEFFDRMSMLYKDEPGVIYEICNEPNGRTDWSDIERYSAKIIDTIRKNAPDAVIIVGTPNHCTDFSSVAKRPLEYRNILYSYHFYINDDNGWEFSNLDWAIDTGLPLFVSEWGIEYDDEKEINYFNQANEMLSMLDNKMISWVFWSLSNKDEPYAILKPTAEAFSGWEEEDLTEPGKYIFSKLR